MFKGLLVGGDSTDTLNARRKTTAASQRDNRNKHSRLYLRAQAGLLAICKIVLPRLSCRAHKPTLAYSCMHTRKEASSKWTEGKCCGAAMSERAPVV
jgi:hypothetical protein